MKNNITKASLAGFCFGVDRAVELAMNAASRENIFTLGPIIHNTQMVQGLEKRGVKAVLSVEELPLKSTLILSAHGTPKSVIDLAKSREIGIIDATCPYVTKIHRIAAESFEKKRRLLVAGDENHTEVKGIVGHFCSKTEKNCEIFTKNDENIEKNINFAALVFKDDLDLVKMISKGKIAIDEPLTIVAQTTFNINLWKKIKEIVKKDCTNAEIFDTICKATHDRQLEAESLARTNDLMVVVGSQNSSNTKKLVEICEKFTNTVQIESSDEIDEKMLSGASKIGLTAGASAPKPIIEEAFLKMQELLNTNLPEENTEDMNLDMNFEQMLEESLSALNTDHIVKGIVMAITPTEIQVDIGRKQAGIVPIDELSEKGVNVKNIYQVGDELELAVIKTNDETGITTLSRKKVEAMQSYNDIVKAFEEEKSVVGEITAVVKGGLTATCNGVRIFIPGSRTGVGRGDNSDALIGKSFNVKIIDMGSRRRVIGSIKEDVVAQKSAASSELWESIELGQKRTGAVKTLTNYGAFVDIGGMDGLIHVSELTWGRIKHPSEVLEVGQEVEVSVDKIDREAGKISLGYKKAEDNPWLKIENEYKVGDEISVTIMRITDFGAFAEIIKGVDGLIHISQISHTRVENVNKALTIGQSVKVQIIDIDLEAKRVALSIKVLTPDPNAVKEEEDFSDNPHVVADEEKIVPADENAAE